MENKNPRIDQSGKDDYDYGIMDGKIGTIWNDLGTNVRLCELQTSALPICCGFANIQLF